MWRKVETGPELLLVEPSVPRRLSSLPDQARPLQMHNSRSHNNPRPPIYAGSIIPQGGSSYCVLTCLTPTQTQVSKARMASSPFLTVLPRSAVDITFGPTQKA